MNILKNRRVVLLLFAVSSFLDTQSVQARKQAVNDFTQKETTEVRKLIYDVTDFLLYEMFSVTDASPETVQFVRDMQKQMGMERMTIRVRSLSGRARLRIGRENAAAASVPYANTVLISEEWFNTLPEIEKKAIVGHELAHLKNKHIYKSIALMLFTDISANCLYDKLLEVLDINTLSFQLFYYILSKQYKIPLVERTLLLIARKLITWVVVYPPRILTLAIVTAFMRHNEFEADRVSALTFNNTNGVRELMKRFKDLRDPLSRFGINRVLYYALKPIKKMFSTHPSYSKRIKAMENLDPEIRD